MSSTISAEQLADYNFYLEKDGIPQGWTITNLQDVSHVITDGTHKTPKYVASGVRFISIKNIKPFKPVNWDSYEKYITRDEHEELIRRCKPERDDILFPRIGTLGYAKRIDFDEEVSLFVGLGLIKPIKECVLPKYMEYYLNTPYISTLSKDKANGSGRMTLPLEESRKFPFPLPPLNEQRRIVAKIEELFSELDNGIETLTTACEQLKAYRQSILKHAFDGIATSTWRERSGGATWSSITVDEASEKVVDCLHSTPRFAAVGKYCVDSTWVEDNKLLWDQARYVDEATYCERIRRLKPERGDVILVREGSKKIGTALAVNFDDDFCLGQRMMMFRLRDGMLPEYFAYYIQSDNFKKQYKPLIGGSASPHLNISDIKRMRLPVCSPEEQKEVVGFIDVQSSFLDALEATISVEIEKAQALRQSILKHAFSGQLVAQDPADEPASILLQRIRAEKEESGNGRRKNNKNGKKEAA